MIDELTGLELLVTTTRRLQYERDHIDKKTESLYELHADDDGLPRILTCTELKGHCFVLVSGYVC